MNRSDFLPETFNPLPQAHAAMVRAALEVVDFPAQPIHRRSPEDRFMMRELE